VSILNWIRRDVIERELDELLTSLALRKSTQTVFNPYRSGRLIIKTPQYKNLNIYLKKLLYNEASILLLGEAGGYSGLKHSGIPFTSTYILKHHKVFAKNRSEYSLSRSKIIKERSATIVYSWFEKNPEIFWKCVMFNTFNFHPHDLLPNSNRKPNEKEIREGKKYIQKLFEVFEFTQAHGIGRVAFNCLTEMKDNNEIPDIEITYIKHPSYGGKPIFIKNMNDIFNIEISKPKFKDLTQFQEGL